MVASADQPTDKSHYSEYYCEHYCEHCTICVSSSSEDMNKHKSCRGWSEKGEKHNKHKVCTVMCEQLLISLEHILLPSLQIVSCVT